MAAPQSESLAQSLGTRDQTLNDISGIQEVFLASSMVGYSQLQQNVQMPFKKHDEPVIEKSEFAKRQQRLKHRLMTTSGSRS